MAVLDRAALELKRKVDRFLSVPTGSGDSSGYGSGDGSGYGYGYRDGSGHGDGHGFGHGSGDSSGYGSGDGSGYGSGDGSGYGFGSGSGSGSGYRDGYGIAIFCGQPVHMIDGVETIFATVRGNIAKGWILQSDLTSKPCYVAKVGSHFAHGETVEEAVRDAQAKAFGSLPFEERLGQFWESHNRTDRYPASDLYDWHGRLTASCEMGRKQFVADRGIDLDTATYTVAEFVALCAGQYGHEIIKRLEDN